MVTFGLIEVYDYTDLEKQAKWKALNWLDQNPLDYENDEGGISYEYFSDMSDEDVAEHCMMNEYKFDKYGRPIHYLLLLDYNPNPIATQTEEIQNG